MHIDIEKIKKQRPLKELIAFSIINVDKPTGPTSFTVSQFIKDLFKVNKTSHFGTLDPMVTGVLPVALGRACRLNEYFMHRDKEYVGIMHLHDDVSDKDLLAQMQKFVGSIRQLPPVKSNVLRVERVREVKSFELLERQGRDVLFRSTVQAGTYIRKLVTDAGAAIGDAHMTELRRTRAGMFEEKESHTLYEVEKAYLAWKEGDEGPLRSMLIPGEIVAQVLPIVMLKKTLLKKVLTGSPLFETFVEGDLPKLAIDEKICVFCGDQLVGCYRAVLANTIVARPEFVLN